MSEIQLFVPLAATGLSVLFSFVIVAPLLHGLRLLGGRVALRLRRPTSARIVLELSDDPLQPGLSAAHRRLGEDTRSVLMNLEHACAQAHRWSDRAAGPWWRQIFASGSDIAYAPTIGLTGEVWHWLAQAEALADEDGPFARDLQCSTASVRRALFDERPLVARLEAIAVLLAQVDGTLRIRTGSPYRDTLAPKAPLSAGAVAASDDECPEAVRRRRYHEAIRSHAKAIRVVVYRHSAPPEHDDLLQEIHVAIWTALPKYRRECSLRTYVLRVARYRAITFEQRRQELGPEREWTDDAPAPDELLDERRRHLAVARAIGALPATLRRALRLRLDGLSYREIARRLRITEKNASVRVTRARRTLERSIGTEPA